MHDYIVLCYVILYYIILYYIILYYIILYYIILIYIILFLSCIVMTGTCLLILTSTEVDATGASYYGEQALHFVSTKGDAVLVPFGRQFLSYVCRLYFSK